MDPITSTSNTKVKLVTGLQSRARTRRKHGLIVLEGVRLVRDAWLSGHVPEFVLYTPNTADDLTDLINAAGVDLYPVDETVMAHITETQTPQGIVAVYPAPQPTLPAAPARLLLLDAVRDPGNLGTIIRTAAGAGCDAVLLAPGCADPYNPKVLRSAMGAHFRIPVAELSWEHIHTLNLPPCYLAAADADIPYDQTDWRNRWGLIIGSEAHGASQAAHDLAAATVQIPMARATESLNAAIAAAVILFEAARQRRHLT